MKNSLYVPKNTSLSSLKSIIVNVINESGGGGGGASIAANNTWTGVQTFSTAPVISTITNTGTLTLPTTTGTLALTSQIPTNSSFVDLSTNQTIGGIKIFSDIVDFDGGVQGPLTVTDNLILATRNALVSTASTAATSCNYGIINASNGMRSDVANTLRLVTNAADRIIISTSSIQNAVQSRFLSGSAASPGITFTSDTGNNSGWYLIANDQIGTSINGTNVKTLTSSADTSTIQCNMPSLGLTNSGFTSVLSGTLSANRTITIPDVSGFMLESIGNYSTVASQGLSLANNQTISTAGYLAGATINANSSTYTDSATAASGTVGQVSDFLIGARTFAASNTAVTYTSAASLQIVGPPIASTNVTITTPNAIQVDSGNVRLTNGRVLSTALGTAALPAFAIGALLTDGIYSSAAGSLNISTSGSLRATFSGSAMTFGANYSITTSGTATITSGSGGFTSAGPVSSSLASSAAACSVRPTNNANTGLFGTAATNVSVSVGGTAIVSCGTTGAAVTGTLSASGLSTLTGLKIGSIGSTTSSLVRGTVSYAVALAAGGYVNVGANNFAGSVTFSSTPSVIVSIQQATGATLWDQCIVTVVAVTTTQVTFAIKSVGASATTGTVFLNYVAWN